MSWTILTSTMLDILNKSMRLLSNKQKFLKRLIFCVERLFQILREIARWLPVVPSPRRRTRHAAQSLVARDQRAQALGRDDSARPYLARFNLPLGDQFVE